ncbi:putative 2Fe-2S ferredoxin [Pseudomonas phage OBP]|uniref:ferredoxin n=1 Tax=Pseudomonas phage OBP TaxID=1124849 RepID=UPI000240D5B6|nr:ferredoxin [Pseudomonas phage OBP]AEV89647.1 putative 2Fe-2S ferredoxin [Pseudomonas phage OBP]
MSLIKLFKLDKEVEVKGEHPSLLAALEANQVEVEYQCREGYCGSCRCKLLKGEVTWIREPLAFINKGEILPCCVKPKGDIEIDL